MSLREEQCNKVCRILDDVLANRPTERDSLIVAVRKAFEAEPQERKTGWWIDETFKPWGLVHHPYRCSLCGEHAEYDSMYCPNCGCKMEVG